VSNIIDYTPPPTIKGFIRDYIPGELFMNWIVGPVGSGKTTGIFFKLCYMAALQVPSPDGVRRTRAVVVRNTMPQLKDTTMVSWGYWFKQGQAGHWNATDKIFTLRFGDVECEVLFRPLDTPDDVERVLSLEVTFVIIDEFVQIPKPIIDALSARVGRYKMPDGTPVTNWGMWGSSNPSTEDNWWFDYLHGAGVAKWRPGIKVPSETNARYFLQPSALSPEAENVENLPGKEKYYSNLIKGKSDIWVNQFVRAEWGFSISGTPVVPSFKENLHVSKRPLIYNPHRTLVVGLDPGLGGSAMIFGQQDEDGVLYVLDELVQAGLSAEQLITEKLKPKLRQRFPNARVVIAPDPAAANRSKTDKSTVVKIFQKHFDCVIESNNRLPLRLDAIGHFTNRLVMGRPALQIDPCCRVLVRALKGGWRYAMDSKKDMIKGAEPEKNPWSHPGDGFGYLARYFHKLTEREMRYKDNPLARSAPQNYSRSYHVR
jgi:hypothetical protein